MQEVLELEMLDIQEQNHDDVELSVKPDSDRGDSLDEENTQTKADNQELVAGGSNNQRKANAATAKPTNQKIKSEEQNVVDQKKSKDSEKIKVHLSSKSRFSEVKKNGAE
jgi:hypothetical protein